MTETGNGAGRSAGGTLTTKVLDKVTSTALILLTLAAGLACVIALASTLTQTRISNVTIDGVPISIWKLDSIRAEWTARRAQLASQSDAVSKANDQRIEINDRLAKANAQAGHSYSIVYQSIQNLAARIQMSDPDLAKSLSNTSVAVEDKTIQISAADATLRQRDSTVASLLDSVQKAYTKYLTDTATQVDINAELEAVNARIDTLQKGIKDSQSTVSALFDAIKPGEAAKPGLDDQTRARIENALYELDPSGGSFGGFMNRLVTLQPDVLGLSLVLLMGILGSSLQILNSVFSAHRIESIGSYALRLSVGAITALVIFIVSKAGIPVIADTSKLGGDAPINPYFVSFLANISGLLSEQAIITVQNQGQRFFGPGGSEPDRWARSDLTPEVTAINASTADLASYLGTNENEAFSILKGQAKADAEQQRTIAVFLRGTVRELFSDIPPPDHEEAGAGAQG